MHNDQKWRVGFSGFEKEVGQREGRRSSGRFGDLFKSGAATMSRLRFTAQSPLFSLFLQVDAGFS